MRNLRTGLKPAFCSLILVFSLLYTCAQVADTTIYSTAEVMPVYPGGNDSLLKEITRNVVYPQMCADSNIQGKVYLRFVVNTDGTIANLQVIKSPHPILSVAALDATLKIGKFTPGMQAGKSVKVWYSLPVNFKIKKPEAVAAEIKADNPRLIDSLNAIVKELEEEKAFTFVDEAPEFPGGERALIAFLQHNIHYPAKERDNDIGGKVLTRFVVTEEGKVEDIQVLKGVSPGLDQEAKRVLSMLPDFKPGIHQGKPVKVYFNLPVAFKLGYNNGFQGEIIKNLYEYYDGNFDGFCRDIQANLTFPEKALKNKIEAQIQIICKIGPDLKLIPITINNDIDSLFTFEALRLLSVPKPFKEEIRQSTLLNGTVKVTIEFIFDKRHQWNGSGKILDSNQAKSLTNDGANYFKAGKLDKALESFDAALRYFSISEDALYNRALTRFKQGDKEGACDDFKRAFLLGAYDAKKGIELSCQ